MNGTELITYLGKNAPALISAVEPIVGAIITAVFLRSNTATTEFEKVKSGKFNEVIEELLDTGYMSYTEFYKAKNFLKIAKKADKYYSQKSQKNQLSTYDFDWFIRYYEAAGNISEESMQEIWAKVLAGEISNPSFFSLRIIDILRNMRKSDAELFERFCEFSFATELGSVFLPNYDGYLQKSSITYSDIMRLSEMGLIFNDALISLKVELQKEPGIILVNRNFIMTLASQTDKLTKVNIKQYPFTRVGQELATLVSTCPSDESFIEFGKELAKTEKFKVSIHRIIQVNGDDIQYEKVNILEQ